MNETKTSRLLDVRVQHRIYDETLEAMIAQAKLSRSMGGAIVPLLGPTRCGKTELLSELRDTLDAKSTGPGSLIASSSFGLGVVPPKPNDRDLYRAMLQAIGYDCGPKERTGLVRERLISAIQQDGIDFIALDEASHCAEPGANLSPRAAADHFKAIVDATGVTLILSGLPKFQKIIDGNEQFRERALRTTLFPPYTWSSNLDRQDFTSAVLSLFAHIEAELAIAIEFDDLEMARRLYGATGGRVGLSARILAAALSLRAGAPFSIAAVKRGAEASLQDSLSPELFFREEPPSDLQLSRAYLSVMKDADLRVSPSTLSELEAF